MFDEEYTDLEFDPFEKEWLEYSRQLDDNNIITPRDIGTPSDQNPLPFRNKTD